MDPAIEQRFLTLYDETADAVYRHCYFRVHDRELAKDMTQEAYARTWNTLAKGGIEIDNLKAFLFRIASNLVIDHYRKKKEASLEVMAESGFDPVGDDAEVIVDHAAAGEALAMVQHLPDNYREVIVLRFANNLTITEIAEIIGENENAVSVRIHRALKKLKELLTHGTP